jgi:NTP pyrophosphatase (non-canonical NTP hydrolase)
MSLGQKANMQSLRHLTIEETYELGDAILDNDLIEVKKTRRLDDTSFLRKDWK